MKNLTYKAIFYYFMFFLFSLAGIFILADRDWERAIVAFGFFCSAATMFINLMDTRKEIKKKEEYLHSDSTYGNFS